MPKTLKKTTTTPKRSMRRTLPKTPKPVQPSRLQTVLREIETGKHGPFPYSRDPVYAALQWLPGPARDTRKSAFALSILRRQKKEDNANRKKRGKSRRKRRTNRRRKSRRKKSRKTLRKRKTKRRRRKR